MSLSSRLHASCYIKYGNITPEDEAESKRVWDLISHSQVQLNSRASACVLEEKKHQYQ